MIAAAAPRGAPWLSGPVRYAFAAAVIVLAALVHWLLTTLITPLPPFLIFYPGVLLVVMVAGSRPGILAGITAALISDYWLFPPSGSFAIKGTASLLSLGIFLGLSLVLCVLAELLRRAPAREAEARRAAELAEARVQQLLDAAKAEKEWLAQVLNSINEEIYFTDTEGRYSFANPAALQEFAHTSVVGIKVRDIVERMTVLRADGTPRPIEEAPPLRALAGEVVRDEEQIVRTPRTGELRNRLVSSAPVRDARGCIIGAVSAVRDITAIKRIETALRETDRQKNVFLATLAHELRNPLAPIRTASKWLTAASRAEDLERCRTIISRQVALMASLLEDLLDISRFTRGKLSLKKSYAGLRQILDAAVETAHPLIASKRHRLVLDVPTGAVTLEADPVRLTQVVSNLLTNAAKYTNPGGEIFLICKLSEAGLIIRVRDTGIGLAPEAFNKVFDMFVQIETFEDRAEGGLGIGLALVKALVELHGGRIGVHSEGRDRGCTFEVTLPRSMVIDSPDPALHCADGGDRAADSRCVLVADDNADGAETLQMLLCSSGHEVHVAHDGIEALEIAFRVKPDIAVLDIGMPGLNGYEVATRIRAEAWGASMTLVALTGWGQEDDKRNAQAAGFDHHLTKPADPDRLDAIVAATGRTGSGLQLSQRALRLRP